MTWWGVLILAYLIPGVMLFCYMLLLAYVSDHSSAGKIPGPGDLVWALLIILVLWPMVVVSSLRTLYIYRKAREKRIRYGNEKHHPDQEG